MKLLKLPEAEQARRHWLVDLSVRLIKTKPLGTGCGIIVLALILVSIFADALAPYPYDEIRLQEILQPPSAQHLLGTDHVGRDYLSRIIQGARVSMLVGLAATTINVVVAILVGGTTGFLGGKVDLVTQRFVDAWIAFPGLLLLLTLMSVAGRGVLQMILVLGISGGIGSGSRVVRSAVIGIKENVYFEAGEAIGASKLRALTPPRLTQHRAAHHHHLQHQHRRLHPERGIAELPRLRPAAGHPRLGRDAEPRGASVHGGGAAAGALAGPEPDAGRIQLEHVRRRAARPARPAAARRDLAGQSLQRMASRRADLPRPPTIRCCRSRLHERDPVRRISVGRASRRVRRLVQGRLGLQPRGRRTAAVRFSRDRVLSSLAESLERLRLDAIDMVFLHLLGDTPYHYQQALHEALPALAELRSQGVVRAIGVGTTIETWETWETWEMLAPFAQEGGSDCFLVASRYTLMDHSALEQFLPLCLERRIGVVLGGPYYMGILATDLTPRAVFDLFLQHRPGDAEILRQARRIGAVCANHGVPLKAAALQFGLSHPAVAATLIGTSTPQQVEENVQMASVPVPAALWAQLKPLISVPVLTPARWGHPEGRASTGA